MASNYTEASIKTLSSLEHIRLRPGMYIGRLGNGAHAEDGIYVLLKETIDNSIDEFMMGQGKKIEVELTERSVKVRDYGRGIPLGKLVDCVSIINTGREIRQRDLPKGRRPQRRRPEGGQRALARTTAPRPSARARPRSSSSSRASSRASRASPRPTSATARSSSSRPTRRSSARTSSSAPSSSRTCCGTTPSSTAGSRSRSTASRFKSEHGLKDLLTKELSGEPLYPIIHLEGEDIEIALTHGNHYGEEYWSFVNGQHTTMGGTHLAAFREALVETVRNHFKKDYDAADVRQSIDAAIVVRVQEPVFESQTKTKLGSDRHRPARARRSRNSSASSCSRRSTPTCTRTARRPRSSRRRSRKTSTSGRNSPASATSRANARRRPPCTTASCATAACTSATRIARAEESTLFIVEGDSAAGSLTATRDVQTQAVFALKGKPLNTYGLTKKVIYENEEFHLLQSALNIEEGLDGLRYNKIVIATDADVDGMHIRLLLLSFFLQFFPDVIRNSHLFILQTPLFRVRNKKATMYCYTEQEKQAAVAALGAGHEITRFKGLGEISAGEFKDFIGENIRLDPVNLHHLYSSRRTALVLHGQEHARAAGLHHREPPRREGPRSRRKQPGASHRIPPMAKKKSPKNKRSAELPLDGAPGRGRVPTADDRASAAGGPQPRVAKRKKGEKVQDDQAPLAQSYRNWFLDYASYVILDRAVPHIDDGLKPVQRRVLHTLWDMDDGRFHKVANVVGATMKLHPHGDASIGAALVVHRPARLAHRAAGQLRQPPHRRRCRRAALHRGAPHAFAKDVLFNPKTTTWQLSYDGRNREPVTLPAKFPDRAARGRRRHRGRALAPRSCRTISTTSAARRSITSREKPSASSRISPPAAPPIFPNTTTASAAAR